MQHMFHQVGFRECSAAYMIKNCCFFSKGHFSVVQSAIDEWWAVFHESKANWKSMGQQPRMMFIEQLKWNDHNWPIIKVSNGKPKTKPRVESMLFNGTMDFQDSINKGENLYFNYRVVLPPRQKKKPVRFRQQIKNQRLRIKNHTLNTENNFFALIG